MTVELKEERIKSFFNTTLHCKQACNLPKYVLKESKKVIYFEVFETIWTGVRTFQNGHPTPLLFLCFPLSFTYHSLQCPPGFLFPFFLGSRRDLNQRFPVPLAYLSLCHTTRPRRFVEIPWPKNCYLFA